MTALVISALLSNESRQLFELQSKPGALATLKPIATIAPAEITSSSGMPHVDVQVGRVCKLRVGDGPLTTANEQPAQSARLTTNKRRDMNVRVPVRRDLHHVARTMSAR